ncbi:Ppx/GppA phosphatase family protein [Paenibacillus nasutitermitis]|uniref:Exopolyphosphatase n=1 Tax=Paenibacillus nasutitermitis TaxID=1652958 RepID=A0A916Z2V5_9BACL|nr:Ppx/GppA phosphatase family protein [Paenibacillus nasutitermitis]GGD74070.1 exopolyphosphatase [Paenibacillus nasutitermitis]
MTEQRIGIIDLGSNSVRLVVYERTASGAHRVIDGSKRSARLSEQIDENGVLPDEALDELVDTINHFRLICAHHRTGHIRAIATAAIRNAANREQILFRLEAETGMPIEVITGMQEASYGFLGMINSMNIQDGFLIDIGGGSTEVSLFRNRSLVNAVSFPFGCVSLTKRFAEGGLLSDDRLQELEMHIAREVGGESWISHSPGLPLVGIGGTVRALGKIHQAVTRYPFESFHNYTMTDKTTEELFHLLRSQPLDKRNRIPGLAKDRTDIIVPGLTILRTLFKIMGASHYLVCGSGLRDGLFFSTRFPERPKLDNVLEYSVNNLAALHPEAPRQHMAQVSRNALQLFDALQSGYSFPEQSRSWLDTASTLYRIGASIDYYDYNKHTFYLIVNSHINGLSHKETLLCAAIASFKSRNRARQQAAAYKPLVSEEDLSLICMLGSLLQLAIALDRSETQAIGRLRIEHADGKLLLYAAMAEGSLVVERKEVDALASDFRKLWGIAPVLYPPDYR